MGMEFGTKGFSALLGTMLTSLLGAWDSAIQILAIFIVLDVITGFAKAGMSGNLRSREMYEGMARKLMIFVAIIISVQLDLMVGNESPIFRTMTLFYYSGQEGLSILENLGSMGVPLPEQLRNALLVMRDKGNSHDDI